MGVLTGIVVINADLGIGATKRYPRILQVAEFSVEPLVEGFIRRTVGENRVCRRGRRRRKVLSRIVKPAPQSIEQNCGAGAPAGKWLTIEHHRLVDCRNPARCSVLGSEL